MAPPMGSTFGRIFRVATFGESHGPAVGVVIDGCPPGVPVAAAEIQAELDRRRPGQSRLTTQRREADAVEVLSGVFEGVTTGHPIALLVRNEDARPEAYLHLKDLFRPSHADFTYRAKYGVRDWRGGGRSSARETIGRVAAGAVARKLLGFLGIEVVAWVRQVHTIEAAADPARVRRADVEANPVRCPDARAAARMARRIEAARRDGDSVGGVIELAARGVPPGLGEPVFDRLEADLAKAMLSLPATKGFEVGSGFAGARLTGSQHNDPYYAAGGRVRTRTNRSGGVQGGISDGEDIVCRVAFKPTATINRPQRTVTVRGGRRSCGRRAGTTPACSRVRSHCGGHGGARLADHLLRHRAQCGMAIPGLDRGDPAGRNGAPAGPRRAPGAGARSAGPPGGGRRGAGRRGDGVEARGERPAARLYAITATGLVQPPGASTRRRRIDEQGLLAALAAASRGGLRMVQIREKSAPVEEVKRLVAAVREVLAPGSIVVVNATGRPPEFAAETGADGVHIGGGDPAAVERARVPSPPARRWATAPTRRRSWPPPPGAEPPTRASPPSSPPARRRARRSPWGSPRSARPAAAPPIPVYALGARP